MKKDGVEGAIATMTELIVGGRPILLRMLLNILAPMTNTIAVKSLEVREHGVCIRRSPRKHPHRLYVVLQNRSVIYS